MALRSGTLPKNTPLKELGYSKSSLSKLTPTALKLTKGDLIALQKWAASGAKGTVPEHLKVKDLSSLRRAFGPLPLSGKGSSKKVVMGDNVQCCCCTPCCSCSAAAEIAPIRLT